jgi:hypothetical protein
MLRTSTVVRVLFALATLVVSLPLAPRAIAFPEETPTVVGTHVGVLRERGSAAVVERVAGVCISKPRPHHDTTSSAVYFGCREAVRV